MLEEGVALWRTSNPGVPLPPGPWAPTENTPEESTWPQRRDQHAPSQAVGPAEGPRQEAWQGQPEPADHPRTAGKRTIHLIGGRAARQIAEADQLKPATPPSPPTDLTDEEWEGIEVGGRYSIREIERRVDPNDGRVYIWEEFRDLHPPLRVVRLSGEGRLG